MNELQATKYVNAIPPAVIKDNAAFVAAEIDCLDFDCALVLISLGATDIAMAALSLQECDTTGGSFADVTGTVWGTAANIAGATSTLPAAGDDNKVFAIEVDCRKRKRFLKLAATAGDGSAGTYLSAVAILSRGDIAPVTAAQRGAAEILRV
jgi:hypothetical protein